MGAKGGRLGSCLVSVDPEHKDIEHIMILDKCMFVWAERIR